MTSESLELAKARYKTGKAAFENGKYREAVENLEKSSALLARNSRFAGEVEIWLATAYEAAGRTEDAITLCERLKRHPYPETSKEAKRLQYILQAPKLKRPEEWMTKIPDFTDIPDNESKIRLSVAPKKSSGQRKKPEPELVDLTQVNTKDNRFITIALLAIALTVVSLVWFSI
ncbi:MAG: tetratricopeptide repeat protein [Mastigocoleus sp. MO_167.B18]|nr:tetratricopeptide repeat protein [Mastigocoleus sp. MO_167.B18]